MKKYDCIEAKAYGKCDDCEEGIEPGDDIAIGGLHVLCDYCARDKEHDGIIELVGDWE